MSIGLCRSGRGKITNNIKLNESKQKKNGKSAERSKKKNSSIEITWHCIAARDIWLLALRTTKLTKFSQKIWLTSRGRIIIYETEMINWMQSHSIYLSSFIAVLSDLFRGEGTEFPMNKGKSFPLNGSANCWPSFKMNDCFNHTFERINVCRYILTHHFHHSIVIICADDGSNNGPSGVVVESFKIQLFSFASCIWLVFRFESIRHNPFHAVFFSSSSLHQNVNL